jgi:hypothetical protein
MLGGQVAVFVSCSEKFKEAVAWPVRDALAEHGLRGIIVSDEPPLPGTGEGGAGEGGAGGHSAAKVESYLDASSAFVALCTADYALSDGTTYPRANIIDEIQLASLRPHLRDHSQILKSREVLLPSSITPTYDRLDMANPVLSRRDAYAILDSLCESAEPRDRHAVAQALLDVAAVKPAAVAADLAERLLTDPDPLVARQAQDVETAIEHVSDADQAACYARFGL